VMGESQVPAGAARRLGRGWAREKWALRGSRAFPGFGTDAPVCGGFRQPRRGVIRQPRATPWDPRPYRLIKPCMGAISARLALLSRPFRAAPRISPLAPRAMPWAVELRPFGAGNGRQMLRSRNKNGSVESILRAQPFILPGRGAASRRTRGHRRARPDRACRTRARKRGRSRLRRTKIGTVPQ
jgi:hypothetical protein